MAPQDVIREFLVAIGWKNDEVGMKKAFDSIAKAEKTLVGIAATAEAASLAVVAALGKMAEGFERAYYSSSRTGVAIKELGAFKFAVSQTGASAEEASSAIEGLAEKIRSNRGYRDLVTGITKDKTGDLVKQLLELGVAMRGMSSERAYATGQILGLSEHTRLALMDPEVGRYHQEQLDRASAMGVDLEKAGADGRSLTRSLRDVRSSLDLIIDAAATPLFQKLDGPLRTLDQFLQEHGKDIARIIGDIAAAFLRITTYILEKLPDADKFVRENLGGWGNVFLGLATIISATFVARLAGMVGALGLLSRMMLPPWALALLGVGAGAVAGNEWLKNHSPGTPEGDANEPNYNSAKRDMAQGGSPVMNWIRTKLGVRGREGFARRVFGNDGPGDKTPISGGDFDKKAPGIMSRLKADFGLTNEDAAAILGNLGHESAGFRAFKEGGGGPGRGWAQWTDPGRKARFFDYAKKNGLDPQSDEANYGFLRWELNHDHSSSISALKNATGLEAKTRAFEGSFEGAGVKAYDSRYAYARRALAHSPPALVRVPPMRVPGHDGKPVPMPPNMPMPSAPPLFPASPTSSNVVIHDNSKTTVNGVSDPTKAADHVGRADDRRQSVLLRNLQSAVG